jgi:hypothetical protein
MAIAIAGPGQMAPGARVYYKQHNFTTSARRPGILRFPESRVNKSPLPHRRGALRARRQGFATMHKKPLRVKKTAIIPGKARPDA